MNFENINLLVANNTSSSKSWCLKCTALSLSLFLGACASTGDRVEPSAQDPVATVEKTSNVKQQAPARTAAELMKTLKAPLVEPPGEEKTVAQVATTKTKIETKAKQTQDKVVTASTAVKKEAAKVTPVKVAPSTVKTVTPEKAEAPVSPAPAPKPVVVAKVDSTGAKAFNVSASKLPFTYDLWTIKEGNTPLTQGLVITTPTWQMGKEGYTSQIWLTMMEDKIFVNSSSDIETASKGLGIRIDDGDLIPFTSIAENNIGVLSGNWLNKLALANKIDIYLGFFPGKKPTSETFQSDLSLDNLARVVATYRMLNR